MADDFKQNDNPYLDDTLMFQLQQFAPQQNEQFITSHKNDTNTTSTANSTFKWNLDGITSSNNDIDDSGWNWTADSASNNTKNISNNNDASFAFHFDGDFTKNQNIDTKQEQIPIQNITPIRNDNDKHWSVNLVYGYIERICIDKNSIIPIEISEICYMYYTDKKVQNLIDLITNMKIMQQYLSKLHYNDRRIPLKQVDKSLIQRAYKLLSCIYITGETWWSLQQNRSVGIIEHHEYYRDLAKYKKLIPHLTGFDVPDSSLSNYSCWLLCEMQLIKALSGMPAISQLLSEPANKRYDLLKYDIDALECMDEEYKMVENYLQSTHDEQYNKYSLIVENIYKLNTDCLTETVAKEKVHKNRMLLWYGDKITNIADILLNGLQIPAQDVPILIYKFGKGVYFSDICSQSANNCCTTTELNIGFMILCEVALGDMNKLCNDNDDAFNLLNDKKSTKGCGQIIPDSSRYMTLDNGCIVPCGKPIKSDFSYSRLRYNEYVVYDLSQIKMKYLVQLKFDHQSVWQW